MEQNKLSAKDILLFAGIFILALAAGFLARYALHTETLIPAIFILAVFLISLYTNGWMPGVIAALAGTLAVNFVFTFPYYNFNFTIPENFFSALIMLTISIATSMLTTRVVRQEKLRAESDLEKMRANLLRAISHDLRTPLTTIYGSCMAAAENYDLLSKKQHLKLLDEIREDAEWLTGMVENLLSVTRIDAEGVELIKTPTVLDELIDSAVIRFHKRFPEQTVMLELPDDFVSIPMDAMLIQQVLNNLLENAVQHAKGMRQLKLKVFVLGNRAIFEVSDDGCGIPGELMEHLFDGYLPRHNVPADGLKSSMGIGLSVCSAIVRAHGGDISAQNRKEGGCIFRFSLPMEEQFEK